MKKLLCSLIAVLLVMSLFSVTACALTTREAEPQQTEYYERLLDMAGLLTEEERANLSETLDEICQRQQFNLFIVTDTALPDGYSAEEYADELLDEYFYSDGCLLLISMEDRDWYISTSGEGIPTFTDAGIQYIGERMVEAGLSDGDYAAAFNRFAELCDEFITQARDGEPFDTDNLPQDINWFAWIAASLVAGLLIAFIPVGMMKAKLNSVAACGEADDYIVRNSRNVTHSRDVFMYATISRTRRETESNHSGSSTHTSSSGTSHGGGGGKF